MKHSDILVNRISIFIFLIMSLAILSYAIQSAIKGREKAERQKIEKTLSLSMDECEKIEYSAKDNKSRILLPKNNGKEYIFLKGNIRENIKNAKTFKKCLIKYNPQTLELYSFSLE